MTGPDTNHTTESNPRLAAIDVGTNSIRLEVAEVLPDDSYRVIDDEKVITRLGRGLAATGRISRKSMEASADAIVNLKKIAEGCDATIIRAVATSAAREATNGDDLVTMVRDRADLELDVISEDEEARLAFICVSRAFDLGSHTSAIIDVGGGSTEIVLSSGHVVERLASMPLGGVRLTEQFDLAGETIAEHDYKAMRRHIRKTIKATLGKMPFAPHLVFGTGGTLTTLAGISLIAGDPTADPTLLPLSVRGHEVQRSELRHVIDRLRQMSLRERAGVAGLNPDRADIIVAGLTIVDVALKRLGVNRLRVHDEGIRAGLIYDMIDELNRRQPRNASVDGVDRIGAVRAFASSCHHDHRHAEHVAELALRLFDELAAAGIDPSIDWSTPEHRELLHAAALLHDVGYLVNYSKHHKHSHHLIMHSGLPGYSRRELSIIANLARYHRGARPKIKHSYFANLSPEDQDLVSRLAAILRVAVGLDRSHMQRVQDVSVHLDGGDTAIIESIASEEPSVELWGARRKSRLFSDIFKREPRFTWTPTRSSPAPDTTPAPAPDTAASPTPSSSEAPHVA